MSTSATRFADEVRGLLALHDLPPGLIPGEVVGFEFDEDRGRFQVRLAREVETRFSGISTRYQRELRGTLRPGEIIELKGVKARLGLLLTVTAIRRDGDALSFSVGRLSKRLPLRDFLLD